MWKSIKKLETTFRAAYEPFAAGGTIPLKDIEGFGLYYSKPDAEGQVAPAIDNAM